MGTGKEQIHVEAVCTTGGIGWDDREDGWGPAEGHWGMGGAFDGPGVLGEQV